MIGCWSGGLTNERPLQTVSGGRPPPPGLAAAAAAHGRPRHGPEPPPPATALASPGSGRRFKHGARAAAVSSATSIGAAANYSFRLLTAAALLSPLLFRHPHVAS